MWARRPNKKQKGYEYKVLWKGFPLHEASYVDEQDIQGSLIAEYDLACPRGSCRTDLAKDIDAYVRANPKSIKQSSTAHYDTTVLDRLRGPTITDITEPPSQTSRQDTAHTRVDTRRSKRLQSQDLNYINRKLDLLDNIDLADAILSDVAHLRDILITVHGQDLQLGYHKGHQVINDVIDLNNNCTDAPGHKPRRRGIDQDQGFEIWRDGVIHAAKDYFMEARTTSPSTPQVKTVHFDVNTKTTSAHRVLRRKTKHSS